MQLAGIVDEAADADTALDKKTFFTLTNGELWQFDHGDALGLELTGSFADDDASQLTAVGNNLFFVADDAVSGTQNRLWQINASGAFTEITGALPATSIGELTEAGGDLFYVVDGDTLRKQVSGGTTTTTLVNDNNAISMLTEVNGEIQFRHNDGHSIELWTANGTAEPVMDGSAPIIDNHDDLTAVGAANAQVLYFTATDNANGNELWEIDGSGRLKAVDVNTTGNSSPAELLDIGGELFFVATDDGTRRNVFNYDGTTVTDLTGNFFTIADGPQSLTESNGILFFSAAEDDTASGRELWKIVSPTGTPVLTEIEIDTSATGSAPQNLVDVSNTLFFSANDGSGAEIWSSDGGAVGAGTDPAFSGPGSVVVAFDFASFDGVLNAGEGWYIDDILIGSDLELSDADNVIDLGVEIISVAGLGDFDGADATPIDDLGLLTDAADELQVISGDASLAASITSGDVTVDIAGGAGVTANHKLSAAGDVDGDGTTDALISGPDITDDTWLVHNKGDTQLRGTGALMTALGDVDGDGRSDLGLVSTETSPTIGEDGELLEHQVGHLFLGRDIGDLTEILNLGTFRDPDLVIEPEQPDYVSVGGSFVRPLVFEGVGDVGVSPLSGVTVFGDLTGTGVAGQALIAASGTVEVLVAFPASASDTDTTYTISLQGGGVLREAHVNQRLAPAGKIVGSTHYHSLGTVSLPAGGVLEVKTDGAILNTGGALDAQDVVVVSHNADFGLAEAFGSQVNVFLGHPIVANPLVTETEETPEAYIFDLAPPFISPTFNTGVDGLILPGTHQQVSIDTEPTIAAGSVSGPVDTEVELFTADLSGELSSLDVRIRLDSATATSDNLSATLTSPSGIVVTLFSDIDASAGLDVTFTDDSGRLIADAVAGEFVGTLRPEQSLSDFVGENPDGVWILTFSNDDRDQGAVLAEAALGISVVSDLTALDPDALNALEAPALEGERAGDELSAVQNIGDFSGDGVDDLLVSGNGAHYVIFGPLNLDEIGDVEKFADLVIDAAAVGDPADLMGNINGDTYNDLVFVRHDVSSNDSFVTVFFGGVSDAVEAVVSTNGDRNRLLTSADADRAFTVDLDNLVTGSLDTGFSTAVLNYDGITDVGYQDSLSVTDPTPTLNTALTGAGVDFQFGDAILSGVLIGQDATNPVPVTSDGVLTITARLDLAAAPNEFLTIDAEGVFSTVLFKNDGKQGGVVTDTIEISKEDLLQLADDGNITFTVTAGNQVNHLWFTDFLSLELTYNEVERDDLLVMSDSGGYVISGADITNGKWDPLDDLTNFEAGDAFNADGDEFTTRIIVSNGSADIQTTVAGDLNGDGLDDTLFTDRDTGAVHLLLGETPSSAARTLDFDNRVFRGDDIQSTVGLGDLNRDGYDEFAALRSVEDGVSSEGGVLVFFGSETLTVGENIIEPDDFSNGTVLNEVSTLVTFSQVGSDGETSTGDAIAQNSTFTDSNGGTNRVIGSTNLGTAGWVDTGTRFRADFATGAYQVSIEAGSDDSFDASRLRAFDADGNLLESVTAAVSGAGNWQNLTITRDVADIAYVLYAGTGGHFSPLDDFRFHLGINPDLVIRQEAPEALGTDLSVESVLSATAGDFNDDGRLDLAIGRASTTLKDGSGNTLDQEINGQVYVFWSAGERGDELLLSQADVVLTGTNELDQFGVLPANARIDANQDGADDLIIGAPGAEGLLGGVKQDAGKLHFVYGSPVQLELAAEEDIFVLANRTFTGSGDFLADLGTGQPDIFELADLNGDFVDDFALQDGEFEKWYRFTTLGDGQAGNAVRLSPAFGAPTAIVSTFDNGASGVIDVNGSNGAMEFDLGIFQGIVIEDGDIAAGTLLLAYDDAIAGNLQVRLVTGEGDGSISGDNVATSTLIDTIAFSSGSGLLEVDLTSTLLNELAVGHTRITLQFVATSGSLDVFSSSADERTRIDVDTSGGPGVLMDVLDADGRRVAEATSVLDMRNLDAGTYHLHVYRPDRTGWRRSRFPDRDRGADPGLQSRRLRPRRPIRRRGRGHSGRQRRTRPDVR